jgi:EmrB/QacA subfamily drug resistance transporter
MLIGFKAMQGIGAAMTQGTSMAMITTIFRTSERGKAIGMNASVVGTGGVIGPVAGGLLVSTLGWQWVFHVNVIMGLIAMTTVFVVIDSSMFRQSGRKVSYDWLGAGLSTSTLLAFLLTVTNGARLGWTTTPIFAGAIAFAVLLAAFIWWELRAPSPMLDLNLFKNRVFSLGVATGFVSFLGITSVRFLLPFFLQAAMGMNPGQVGLMMIPNAVSRIVMGPISGRLSDKYGWRTFNVLGLTMTAVGLFVFATLTETSSLFMVVVGIVLQSSGSGIFQSPNSSSIFSAADQSRHGVVSALVNLSRNSANVTGVAVATAIVTGVMLSMGYVTDIDSVVNAGPGTAIVHSFVTGLRVTYLIMGSITLLGAVASFFKGPQPTVTLEESQPQGSGVRG